MTRRTTDSYVIRGSVNGRPLAVEIGMSFDPGYPSARARNWKRHLACESMYCAYCWGANERTRLGGPAILGEQTDIETFGRRRYEKALRAALLEHLRTAHPEVRP